MRHKRIFISGGAGVIGTALVNDLLEEEAILLVGDLKPCPKEWIGKLQYRQGDLNTLIQQEIKAFAPELFFHLAATFERSEETERFWEENFHHNVQLSHHLMRCLKDCSSLKRVIFASSYLVYDPQLYQSQEVPTGIIVLPEETPIHPRNSCGAAKLFHECELQALEKFAQPNQTVVSVRIFRVYGRQSRDVISRWIRAALKKETLLVYCPEGLFDYVFADDVAEGLKRLSQVEHSGVVNLGFGEARSVQEVVDILKRHFPKLQTENVASSIPYEASQADLKRLQEWIHWRPSHSLEAGIAKLIEFEKQQAFKPIQPIPKGILISSLSKKIPLIQAVRHATDKLGQFKQIFGCDCDPNCLGQYGVDQFWVSPPFNEENVEILLNYCRQHKIQAMIPTRDGELAFYAQHRELFEKKGIQILISSFETVKTCLDKYRFAEVLHQQGFPVIATELALADLASVPFYVVKERYGSGSVGIGLKLSWTEAQEHAKQLQNPLFQPFVEGQEWSVDLYRSRMGQMIGCVARQRNVIQKGESQITTTVLYPALQTLCSELANGLNIQGHAVVQVIEEGKGQFHIIECNPRFGGASTASLAVGLDSFYWFLLECLGQPIEPSLFKRIQGEVRQIRYAADRILPWSLSSI
jgi:carbamoyl-phosphate synthase large subunit